MNQSTFDVIAVDLGTTTTSVAVRFAGSNEIKTFSPISGKEEGQKTPSDLHVFCDGENDKITLENSVLGNQIPQKFDNKPFHYHFQAYKMALYSEKEVMIQHPQFPLVKPMSSQKDFRLADVYTIVVAHIKKAILKWFQDSNKVLNMDNTIWVATVPAIAGATQKEFMRKIFTDGMGEINGRRILDSMFFCVLEPEGAFLYALMSDLAKITDGETVNIVAIDVGGGTLDTTVASFQNGMEPEIKKSNFGSCVGGADVDKKFIADIQDLTSFQSFAKKNNVSQGQQQTIMSNILSQFQEQKHEYFGQNTAQVEDQDFEIDISKMIFSEEQIGILRENLEDDEWGGTDLEEDERDIVLLDNEGNYSLAFKVAFAIRRYMDPIANIVNSKIKQLVQQAKQSGCKIDMGFILGGFSFCRSLVSKVQAEFFNDFKISSFGAKSSLAIVMGATMFNRYNLKKTIPQFIGLEVNWPYASLPLADVKFIQDNMPELCCDINKITPVGLKYLFNQDHSVDTAEKYVDIEQQFQAPTAAATHVEFRMHYMPEKLPNAPQNFADTMLYAHTQKVKSLEQRGFKIEIPQQTKQLPLNQRILKVKFSYEIQSTQVLCFTRWPHQADFVETAVSNLAKLPLEKRFEKSKMPKFHSIFVIDRSGSMCAGTLDPSKRINPNLAKDRVGDVVETGIIPFLRQRQQANILHLDRSSVIFFDGVAEVAWDAKQVQNADEGSQCYAAPRGGTDFAPAFKQSIIQAGRLDKSYVPVMIFLSDGDGSWGPDQLLQDVKNVFGTNTHFINFGQSGALDNLASQKFGVRAISAQNLVQLQQVFGDIATAIPVYTGRK